MHDTSDRAAHLSLVPGSPRAATPSNREGDGILAMVETAIAEGRVMLAYQPVVDARTPAQPVFHEGLIRVVDETGQIVPAGRFIETVEPTDLGRRLDVEALRLGIEALRAAPDLRLSINLSVRTIDYVPWRDVLDDALARDASLAQRLILEITESSAVLMPKLLEHFMNDLQAKGICFAIDDFGSGYTSMRYLKDLCFDILKIDGAFTREIDQSPDNRALIEAIVSIARHFDMLIVAERVERPEEARHLQDCGVDCLQGYLYGAPSVQPPWIRTTAQRVAQ